MKTQDLSPSSPYHRTSMKRSIDGCLEGSPVLVASYLKFALVRWSYSSLTNYEFSEAKFGEMRIDLFGYISGRSFSPALARCMAVCTDSRFPDLVK